VTSTPLRVDVDALLVRWLQAAAVAACAQVAAEDLAPCAEFLMRLHRAAESATKKSYVVKKYAVAKLSKASSFAPLSSADVEAAIAAVAAAPPSPPPSPPPPRTCEDDAAAVPPCSDENPEPAAKDFEMALDPVCPAPDSFAIDVEPVPRGRRPAWLNKSLSSSRIAGTKATYVFKVRADAVRAQYYFCLERDLVATDVRELCK
jgi:hypothetical protein